jgi:hypothetical protein
MKLLQLASLLYLATCISAAPPSSPLTDLSVREASPLEDFTHLEKRKGGGGGKGGSGGSSSGGSSGGRSSSGSSGGSTTRPNGQPYSFSPASSAGGRTRSGSGTPKQYGNRYGGGAVVPYTAGARSPFGVAPFFIGAGALAFFPALWLYGSVYAYPWGYPYHWIDQDGRNRTSNVTCLCQQYQVCGCDPDNNSTFLTQTVTNGSTTNIAPVNTSTVRTVTYDNGTTATYVNGSLANGTTADGGTDPSDASQVSPAVRLAMEMSGYWIMIGTVALGLWSVA